MRPWSPEYEDAPEPTDDPLVTIGSDAQADGDDEELPIAPDPYAFDHEKTPADLED